MHFWSVCVAFVHARPTHHSAAAPCSLAACATCVLVSAQDVHISLAESGDRLEFEFDAVAASGIQKRSRHSIMLLDPTLHCAQLTLRLPHWYLSC